jgi:hypothetical protein
MNWISGLLIGYVQIKSLDLFICWVYDSIFKEEAFPYKKISSINKDE